MSEQDTRPQISRNTLFRTGLVVVGLLAGILITLVVLNQSDQYPRPNSVERVQLGSTNQPSVVATLPEVDIPDAMAEVLSLNEAFKFVAGRVTPSVVFIQVQVEREGVFRSFGRRGSGWMSRSVGSGVIISEQGYVVTNNHVIDGAERIVVTLQDKREFSAVVVGTDSDTDLAVLKLDNEGPLPSVDLGNSSDVEVGEWVIAVGNPFRLTSTVTAGIVSALGRNVQVIENEFGIENFIQTDAAINPGNSGGALVNLRGELIGIATAIATESGSYEGYGFAVPVDLMERVVADLIQYGQVQRGYLGVSIQEMNAALANRLGMETVTGVFLAVVVEGLAGDIAGLRDGDVLLSVDGQPVSEPNELQSAIALHRPGDSFEVLIWRNGSEREYRVTLEGREDQRYQEWFADREAIRNGDQLEAPQPTPEGTEVQSLDEWGVGIAGLDSRFQGRFRVPHGVYIAFVDPDGPFGQANVPRDVLLTAIDETPMFNVEAVLNRLNRARERSESIVLEVTRTDGVSLFFEVNVPEAE